MQKYASISKCKLEVNLKTSPWDCLVPHQKLLQKNRILKFCYRLKCPSFQIFTTFISIYAILKYVKLIFTPFMKSVS